MIEEQIQKYCDAMSEGHHRYRSWDYCFEYFAKHQPSEFPASTDRIEASLQLGFFLASWGMYRGRSFLLQRNYLVHWAVIDEIAHPNFSELWNQEEVEQRVFEHDSALIQKIIDAANSIREAYQPDEVRDTLVTKIILGTFGCFPACDRYFRRGLKEKLQGSPRSFGKPLVGQIFKFCIDNKDELQGVQKRINQSLQVRYPIMKLVDMYFWQTGKDLPK